MSGQGRWVLIALVVFCAATPAVVRISGPAS
jgi:hypothetical protein